MALSETKKVPSTSTISSAHAWKVQFHKFVVANADGNKFRGPNQETQRWRTAEHTQGGVALMRGVGHVLPASVRFIWPCSQGGVAIVSMEVWVVAEKKV